MTTKTTRSNTSGKQRIHTDRAADQVVVHWGDSEPDVLKMEDFVKAMKSAVVEAKGKEPLKDRVKAVFELTGEWVLKHKEEITGAWLTERHGHILMIATGKDQYSEPTHDSLIELSMTVANDPAYAPIELETLLLPPVSEAALTAFLSPSFRLRHAGIPKK